MKNSSAVDEIENNYVVEEDEGTMVLFEPTEDECTVVDPSNFIFANPEVVEQEISQNVAPAEMCSCPACHRVIKSGGQFCGYCGYQLARKPAHSNFCPTCGSPIKPGAKFCAKCGYKL